MNTPDFIRLSPFSSANRFARIMAVLVKHGFGEVMERLGLKRRAFFRRRRAEAISALPVWAKLRMVIEELGPTAIKIGQILSMRPDMIPVGLSEELRKLQENVPPAPFDLVEKTLQNAYGRPLDQIFSSIEQKPVATASISQVHRAVRLDGRDVAVKVRLPGVVETIRADLDIMEFFATQVEERMPSLRRARPREVVRALRKDISRELDFTNEAVNMHVFNRIFADDPDILAPQVHGDLVREDVLVMDFVQGARLDACDCTPEQREALARAGLRAVVRQILDEGFFNADPHLGNLRVVEGPRLCYLDFGMCGRLTPSMRAKMIEFLVDIGQNDTGRAVRHTLEMAASYPPDVDSMSFERDLSFALQKTRAPFGNNSFGRFMLEVTALCHEYHINLRPDFILIARALLATESAGRTLAPGLDAMESISDLARQYAVKSIIPGLGEGNLLQDAQDTLRTLAGIPFHISDLLKKANSGVFAVELKQHDYGPFLSDMRRIGNRLGGALVTAALAVGSSVVYLSNLGPHVMGMPVLGFIGFFVSGLLALYLMYKMFRDT